MTAVIVTLFVMTAPKLRNLEIIQQLEVLSTSREQFNDLKMLKPDGTTTLRLTSLSPSSHKLKKKFRHFKISRVMFSYKQAVTKIRHKELAFPLLSHRTESEECTESLYIDIKKKKTKISYLQNLSFTSLYDMKGSNNCTKQVPSREARLTAMHLDR